MLRAPQWHGASQTHFPPRPRKSAWHCDITNVISPHGPPPTRSKHFARYHQSSCSPATRRRRGFESRFESARRAFRTRRPPKVTRQVSKTSVSSETSSKTHMSSAKQAFRMRLPPKVKRKHPPEHTHQAVLQFRDSSPSKQHPLTRQYPNVTATFTSTTTHNLTILCACHETFRVHKSNAHKVLRLPRNVTSVTPRNFMIPRACHANRTSIPQKPRKVLRLPRKVSISYHVSVNKFLHHTTRLE